MTTQQLKELVKQFEKTLDNDLDEWWSTEQEIWEALGKRFVQWYNNYGRKIKEKMDADKKRD